MKNDNDNVFTIFLLLGLALSFSIVLGTTNYLGTRDCNAMMTMAETRSDSLTVLTMKPTLYKTCYALLRD